MADWFDSQTKYLADLDQQQTANKNTAKKAGTLSPEPKNYNHPIVESTDKKNLAESMKALRGKRG